MCDVLNKIVQLRRHKDNCWSLMEKKEMRETVGRRQGILPSNRESKAQRNRHHKHSKALLGKQPQLAGLVLSTGENTRYITSSGWQRDKLCMKTDWWVSWSSRMFGVSLICSHISEWNESKQSYYFFLADLPHECNYGRFLFQQDNILCCLLLSG